VSRTLDPLGLVLKAGVWYLVARRSAGMRVYRVSRFVSVRPREDGFDRPPDFDLAEFWQEWSTTFQRNIPRFDVRLRMPRAALRYLRPLVHPDGRHALDVVRRDPPRELIELVVPFENIEYAYRELMTFGSDVEVIEPLELRERMLQAAEEVIALYG
jgi:predicted DNA-binding transcriptional regulator YafY